MATNSRAEARRLLTPFAERARDELVTSILPFWWRTIDAERGGVFNCWNNAGTALVSRDKFTWSQGRFAWLCARLADATRRGLLPGEPERFLLPAAKTVEFLREHAFLADGGCAFLLTEDGVVKEAVPGQGPAPSIYADCFAMMGLAEFARVSGEGSALATAWRLFQQIETRIAAGRVPTLPAPVPDGYDSHALAMITLNLTVVLEEASATLGDGRRDEIRARRLAAAQRIFDDFMLADGRIVELRPRDPKDAETLLSRHINPGHALEGLWMLLTVAISERRTAWIDRALAAIRFAIERGWDSEFGGMLHFVDHEGGPPSGRAGMSAYEGGVRASWYTKLWWVHSETLYTTALAFAVSGADDLRRAFERVWEYTFRTFPNPNRTVGEWIQIRDRRGEPLEKVVALPVKDPYHIARNLIQMVELVSDRSLLLSS